MKNSRFNDVNCLSCDENNYKVLYKSTLVKKDFDPKTIRNNLKNTLDDSKKHGRIVRCNSCGVVYTNPMENFSLLFKGYKEVEDSEYLNTEKYRKILLQEHLEKISEFKKKGKLLDVGCFCGFFLELSRDNGWDGYGIEPSQWASNVAKKRKIKIIGNDINTIKVKPGLTFDVITMWDVIEHLPNPKKALNNCYTILNKGGLIAIGTPNIESIFAKLLGKNNPYLVRMHLTFYSPKTLQKMLENSGFKVLLIYNYGRTFPVSYILDRIKINNTFYNKFKKIILSSDKISNYPVHLNIGDSFVIIARK